MVAQVAVLDKRAVPKKVTEHHPQFGAYESEHWYDTNKLQSYAVDFKGIQVSEKMLKEGMAQMMHQLEQEVRSKGLVDNG